MAQTGKRREKYIHTMVNRGRGGLWEEWRVEERFAAMLDSDALRRVVKGLPYLLLCAVAAQGQLAGGTSPFAPAVVTAVLMSGGKAGWAAAGGMIGAVIAGEPGVLLTCALLYVLKVCMKQAGLRANDLTCIAVLGLSMGVVPQLYAADAYERLMALLGAAAAMVLAKMMAPALRLRLKERELLCAEEWIGLALLAASVPVGLQHVALWGARPAYAALMLVSLSAGYVGGAGAGAAAGGLAGLMMGLAQQGAAFLPCGLVMMGLLSGLFGRLGKAWAAAAVPLAGMLAVAMDADFLSWGRAAELCAAVVVFLCIKESVWKRLRGYADKEARLRSDAEWTQGAMREALCGRLKEYAALYGRMARRVGTGGGQYTAVSSALGSMAQELGQAMQSLPELAAETARAMDAAGIKVEQVQAYREGEKMGMRLRLPCQRRDGLCDGRILQAASRAAGVTLRVRPTGFCPKDGLCTLELEAVSRYELSVGYATSAQADGQPCGDTVTAVQLPQGRYPSCVLHLTMPYDMVDVNVHPNKLECRFQDESALHAAIEAIVRDAFAEKSPLDNPTVMQIAPQKPVQAAPVTVAKAPSVERLKAPTVPVKIQPAVQPEQHTVNPEESVKPTAPMTAETVKPVMAPVQTMKPLKPMQPSSPVKTTKLHEPPAAVQAFMQSYQKIPPAYDVAKTAAANTPPKADAPTFLPESSKPMKIIGTAFNSYILVEYDSNLLLIDQQGVHERLQFDRMMKAYGTLNCSQELLIPLIVPATRREQQLLETHQEMLQNIGLTVESFGETEVSIRSIPMILGQPQAGDFLREILDQLEGERGVVSMEKRRAAIVALASKKAVRSGEKLNDTDIRELVVRMVEQKITPASPRGTPLIVALSHSDIDRRFRRPQ